LVTAAAASTTSSSAVCVHIPVSFERESIAEANVTYFASEGTLSRVNFAVVFQMRSLQKIYKNYRSSISLIFNIFEEENFYIFSLYLCFNGKKILIKINFS
jgi:hypothetical protein